MLNGYDQTSFLSVRGVIAVDYALAATAEYTRAPQV